MHNEVWGCAEIFPKKLKTMQAAFGKQIKLLTSNKISWPFCTPGRTLMIAMEELIQITVSIPKNQEIPLSEFLNNCGGRFVI